MADPTKKRMTIDFNAQLDATHKAMLEQLADARSRSMSDLVRGLIDSAYRMEFAKEPHCATGKDCLCAQLHALKAAQAPSSAELVAARQGGYGA
jgi:hypothetical protein